MVLGVDDDALAVVHLRRLRASDWGVDRPREHLHLGLESRTQPIARHLEIVPGLQVEPELLGAPEEPREAKRRVRRDGALAMHDLVDAARRHADAVGGDDLVTNDQPRTCTFDPRASFWRSSESDGTENGGIPAMFL